MDSIRDRVLRSIAQRGVWGTLRLSAVIVGWKLLPNFRRVEAQREAVDAAFDAQYGVDTGGVFRPKREAVVGANWALGGNYQATDPAMFEEALGRLHISPEEFVFIDFGSGKGRTLLMAAKLPFKKIIGVEYSQQLHAVAVENIRRFPASARCCQEIEAVHADAAEYPLPREPLVLFLNNPFAEPVMARVVNSFALSYAQHPRRIIVIYFWPNFAHLWEATGLLTRVPLSAHVIFDTGPVGGQGRESREARAITR